MNIVPFQFEQHEVRTVLIDGEPHFVAKDVATALGYVNTSDAIKAHCKGVANHYPLPTAGGMQQLRVIAEGDVLRLIVSSKLPAAVAFERLVFDEILPSIRKTGTYGLAPSGPELLALAVIEAQAMIAAKDERIAELEPAADSWGQLASANGDLDVRDAAQVLARAGIKTGRQRLFQWLRDHKWIDAKNRPYQRVVDRGWLREKLSAFTFTRTNGEAQLAAPQVRITAAGLHELRQRLGGNAVALIDHEAVS